MFTMSRCFHLFAVDVLFLGLAVAEVSANEDANKTEKKEEQKTS